MAFMLLILSCSFGALSCATIMHGPRQEVPVSSQPVGADVYLNGQLVGKAPILLQVSRKMSTHKVRFELDRYEPYELILSRHISGWFWGNFLFGGLIGIAVDTKTGRMYKFSPTEVHGDLQGVGSSLHRDQIYFSVTLNPQIDWQEIGKLQVTSQ